MAVNAMTSRFGLAAVALLAVVPFLWPSHVLPIPSFHEEWLAALLGLAASVALIGARRLPLPGAALLALALGGMALSQMAFGRAPVPELATLFALYLFWAALLACVGSHLADVFGRARLTRVLASAILAGALLCALAGLFQPWLQQTGWPGFPSKMGGPLGQANHFTSYLWLGLASALYLRTTAVLSGRAFWTAALLLTLSAVLAGQRSSFLYAVALIGIAVVEARMEGAPPGVRRLAMGIGLLFIFLQPISLLLPPMEGGEARPPPATRFLQHADRPSVRLQLWRVGAGGILAAPLLGNGIGSYPGLALTYADTIPPEENPGPSEHAHNLLIDLAAELGLPAALLVLLAGGAWLWRLPRRAAPAEAAWAAASIVILALHSMIEYPLWHTYFLGLLAVVAGAFGAGRGVGRRLLPTALVLGLLLWGGLTLFELRRDDGQLEMAHALGKHPAAMPQAGAALLRIPPTSLLAPWVSTTACVSLDPLRVPLADGLAVCRIGVAFAPTIESGVNMAVLLWREGDTRGASDLLRRFRLASFQYNPRGLDALLGPLEAREPGLRALSEAGN